MSHKSHETREQSQTMDLTVDDKTVYAATGGRSINPTLPSIVLLHGAAMDHTVWVLPIRYFARHHRNVLAIDLPGHGRSEGPPLESIGAIADWVVRLLDTVKVDKAALAGHSMGSLPALEAAGRYPERVRSLALLGTSVPMPVTDQLLGAAEANNHAAFDILTIWGHSRSSQLGGNSNPGMWMLGGGVKLLERSAPSTLFNDLRACNEYGDGVDSAARITCPTLLILGNNDTMTPMRSAKSLSAIITGARTVVLDGCGHSMLAERPNEVLDALIEIL